MTYIPGLKGVVAAETELSSVDGEAGELIIVGYPLEEIAEHASSEEIVYLLWNQQLPDENELSKLIDDLKVRRTLSKVDPIVKTNLRRI